MEHTPVQERVWGEICDAMDRELMADYAVDRGISHQVKVSRRSGPKRETILNFASEDLFIHYEEEGPRNLPLAVRIEEDGGLWELSSNSRISRMEIVSRIRAYLAA